MILHCITAQCNYPHGAFSSKHTYYETCMYSVICIPPHSKQFPFIAVIGIVSLSLHSSRLVCLCTHHYNCTYVEIEDYHTHTVLCTLYYGFVQMQFIVMKNYFIRMCIGSKSVTSYKWFSNLLFTIPTLQSLTTITQESANDERVEEDVETIRYPNRAPCKDGYLF